jgi:hypothetical protein
LILDSSILGYVYILIVVLLISLYFFNRKIDEYIKVNKSFAITSNSYSKTISEVGGKLDIALQFNKKFEDLENRILKLESEIKSLNDELSELKNERKP